MRIALQAIAGLIFGLGLLISGMADPAKVLNFLDLFGSFDPSLILVMGGAVMLTFVGYRLAFRRGQPWLASRFDLPVLKAIDLRLVAGAALFGLGWGLAGFCPGPALVSITLAGTSGLIFVASMLLAMTVTQSWLVRRQQVAGADAS
ncbi:DUF6691 family protein [Oryzibacter oryziterrae]|uniref:DUF6691 family protein n=1 Tax=Oryzibacter oryziterrae TaxID=2766474 RepID=UPI001F3FC3E0|nr:DUF6691 family protein [Oryzibacter oryziterrae]